MPLLLKSGICSALLMLAMQVSAQVTNPFAEEPKVAYSGVREMVTSEGTIKMKEYHVPGKQRMEMDGPSGPMVMISDQAKNKAWMLMASMKMYMEIPGAKFDQQTGSDVKVIEHSKVGSETIDGHKVDKYKSVFEDAQGNRGGGYYWITKDGIPLKMDMVFKDGETNRRMTMTLKDLKIESQPDSLFEIPADYSAMPAMGSEMFSTGMSGSAKSAEGSSDTEEPPQKPSFKSLLKQLY